MPPVQNSISVDTPPSNEDEKVARFKKGSKIAWQKMIPKNKEMMGHKEQPNGRESIIQPGSTKVRKPFHVTKFRAIDEDSQVHVHKETNVPSHCQICDKLITSNTRRIQSK